MTVDQLLPGDVVTNAGTSATYIAQTDHPIWPRLRLVVWRMADGSWSHDALDPHQDVGTVARTTPEERMRALRGALLGSGASRG